MSVELVTGVVVLKVRKLGLCSFSSVESFAFGFAFRFASLRFVCVGWFVVVVVVVVVVGRWSLVVVETASSLVVGVGCVVRVRCGGATLTDVGLVPAVKVIAGECAVP